MCLEIEIPPQKEVTGAKVWRPGRPRSVAKFRNEPLSEQSTNGWH